MKRSELLVAILLVLFASGCAQFSYPSGGGVGGGGGPQPFTITVTPANPAIAGLAQQQFTAKTSDGSKPAFTWSVNGVAGGNATLGTISATGLYTAPEFPPNPNTITISAVETNDSTKSGKTGATLGNPIPLLNAVSPMSLPVGTFTLTLSGKQFAPGATVYLGTTALTTTLDSSTQLTATGAVTTAQVGTLGVYVTNPNPGTANSGTINIQVLQPNSGIAISITPTSAVVGAGNQTQFVATVTGTTNTAANWAVNGVSYGNNTVGSMDGNGNYTAPSTLGGLTGVTITATSQADTTKSANATVTFQNPVPTLTAITPATLGLGAFQITLYGTGFVSTSVVNFGGQALKTTYATSGMITAIGTAGAAGQVSVSVTSPAPGGGTSNSLSVTVTTAGTPVSSPAAVRFLEQSSFGPDPETVNQLQELGFDTYLQNQFAATVTPYQNPRLNDGVYDVGQRFFLNADAGGDQLRERTVFALNEMWVVAGDKVSDPLGYTNYLRTLGKDALGNYQDLMTDITLTPAMGHYLDMVDNDAPAPGQHANENYAREIMQLFTLGLNQLNPDGTPVLDASGNPVPTYTQNDVMDLGRAFTGWTYPVQPGMTPQTHNPEYYGGPMVPVESNHDTGAKTILGQAIPAGQTAEADLAAALNIIFNHPNVGPFVSRQLIEHLVTSNPSPAYVQRVAQAFNSGTFNSYGTGKRGDLQATIAAILLDPEARRGDVPATSVATDGKLREPVVVVVSVARAFHAQTDAGGFTYEAEQMSQQIFYPPTVFNFFPPVNPVAGTTLNGPEFAIFNTMTSLARANFVNDAVYGSIGSNTQLDFSPVVNAGTPDQMVAWLDTLFLHGTTPSQMKQIILTATSALDPSDTNDQALAAIYLYLSSSMYQIQH
ncbi:MAG TPA: DUF1800 family protein [Candidatus Acidoferrum sp.]|nr:DUF1800 family protein [Candidatus Acidoferrum sp.]